MVESDRLDELDDEKIAKAFWKKNKRHLTSYLKFADEDPEEVRELITSVSDNLWGQGLEKQALTANIMLEGGLAHREMLRLASHLDTAMASGDALGEIALTGEINWQKWRFKTMSSKYLSPTTYNPNPSRWGSHSADERGLEFSNWERHLTNFGKRAATQPASVLLEQENSMLSSPVIAELGTYRRSLNLDSYGFDRS
ncbi:hypothetical protein OAQ84_01975, partial [Bdellovibrionales bacterium]|nr:hypothetical protein [Bdellovibrionales bacterium]